MSGVRTYYYRVLSDQGKLRTGFYQLAVEEDSSARQRLERELEGTVISLFPLPGLLAAVYNGVRGVAARGISAEDRAALLRDLGVMMQAGVPVLEAVKTIIEERGESGDQAVCRVASQLHDELDAGLTVSDAFARRPDVFPETVRNLVLIGDQSGNLDGMLIEAAAHTERMMNIGRDIRTAMIYPLFVFATLIAVMVFWLTYVVPQLSDLFRQLNVELPAVTVWLMEFSAVFAAHYRLILVALVATPLLLVAWFRHHEPSRRLLHTALHRLPVSKRIVVASGMASFTEHMAILVRAGVDVIRTLEILSRTTRDLYYRGRLERVRQSVCQGERTATSMRRAGGFPPMVVRMIGVGEESGTLDRQLTHLAAEYRKRLDVVVTSLAEIIKPVIILGAGGLFFFLIIALLLPVYDLIAKAMAGDMGM